MEEARGDAGLRTAFAIAVSVSVAGAGCGGTDRLSKDEYVKRFRAATEEALVAGQRSASYAGGPAAASRSVLILQTLAGRIEKLKAPKAAAQPQEEFVGAVREQSDELQQAVAAYKAGKRKPLETIELRHGPSREVAEREEHALEELKEKGYRVANLD